MKVEYILSEVEQDNSKNAEDLFKFKVNGNSIIEMNEMKEDSKQRPPRFHPRNSLQDFINGYSRFSDVNPLRNNQLLNKQNNETPKGKSRKKVIEELVTNLKTQYVLYNIKYFIRRYLVRINPKINWRSYKNIRIIRNICLFLYGLLMFFEKPWFCYSGTTINLPLEFKVDECNSNKITFANIPFINNTVLRIIEIIITIIIIVTQVLKYKDECNLFITNNKSMNKSYKIMNIIILIALMICLIDLFTAIITGHFPIINFLLRAFIYIYLTRRLRRNWLQIGKVLWRTKPVFFYLALNIIIFSFIGFILFKNEKSVYFPNVMEVILQLYILLSTCNFPDIMLDTFTISKLSIFYFIIYVSINYFIILSYLKTLYYTKYYDVSKEDCINIIKEVILKKENQNIFLLDDFNKFIINQKKKYSLNDNEYNNILIILNLYDKNNDIFSDFVKIIEQKPEDELIRKSLIGKIILKNFIVEIIINVINLLSVGFLFIENRKNILLLCFHFIWSFAISMEFFFLTYSFGIKRVITRHFNRAIFHFFNLISIILLLVLLFSSPNVNSSYEKIRSLFCIFIGLRTIRIFVFLDKFKEIEIIYSIIKYSKEMFYRNLITLYSLYLLFSTLSILLTGGNIKRNSFDLNDAIPPNYTHINFNDFGSAYIACFSLMMINNLQILVKSLTYDVDNDVYKNTNFLQFYFASFYFFSTLIIANIIQTLLLELYLNSGYSLKDANEKTENKNAKEENKGIEYKIE